MSEQEQQKPLSDELASFTNSLNQMTGKVSFCELFNHILLRAKREKKIYVSEISRVTKVSAASISGYRNGRKGLTVESMEKVVNYILSK